jgi:hypothetical protein
VAQYELIIEGEESEAGDPVRSLSWDGPLNRGEPLPFDGGLITKVEESPMEGYYQRITARHA